MMKESESEPETPPMDVEEPKTPEPLDNNSKKEHVRPRQIQVSLKHVQQMRQHRETVWAR